MKVYIQTLGCKINQFDAGVLRERLVASGAEAASSPGDADTHVIFTCTVTGKSDYQCRQAIRRAVREKKDGSRVVVTGCYAQTSPEEIRNIPGVDMVVGNEEKDSLPHMLVNDGVEVFPQDIMISKEFLAGKGLFYAQGDVLQKRIHPALAISVTGRSRAFLKVQEGCDAWCSYCIVPKARGGPRSVPVDEVLAEVDTLTKLGYHEIVLTGVHLGAYRAGEGGVSRLSGLVGRILDQPGLGRLRLSSVEPMEIDDTLMEHMVSEKLCRHFHVPLQSASDPVLASMGRGYTASEYFDVIGRIEKKVPGACLGADVIVGYPGEDDASFEETYARIADSPLNHLHVFSYSPRRGTRAYEIGDPVSSAVKKERSLRLRDLGKAKNRAFREKLIGKELIVVAEEREGKFSGITDNYVRVNFAGQGIRQKDAVRVRITSAEDDRCEGVVV